jgi:hypothetical protein
LSLNITVLDALTVLTDLAFFALIVVEAASAHVHFATPLIVAGQPLRAIGILSAVQHLSRSANVHGADLVLRTISIFLAAIRLLANALDASSALITVIVCSAALRLRTCIVLTALTGVFDHATGVFDHVTGVVGSASVFQALASIHRQHTRILSTSPSIGRLATGILSSSSIVDG